MREQQRERANITFPVRPAPQRTDVPRVTSVNQPLAIFGPWSEGTWFVLDIDVDCRFVCQSDKPTDNGAALAAPTANAPAQSTKILAGVHDFTMPKGCQFLVVSTVTQPPPAGHEINAWPANVAESASCD